MSQRSAQARRRAPDSRGTCDRLFPPSRSVVRVFLKRSAQARRRAPSMMFLDVRGVSDCARSVKDFVLAPPARVVFAVRYRIDTLDFFFHSSIPGLPMPLSTLRPQPFGLTLQDSRSGGSLLLSCETLSFSTPCRFIPALHKPTHRLTPVSFNTVFSFPDPA